MGQRTGKYAIVSCAVLFLVAGCDSGSRTWQGIELNNDYITMKVVPEIGGRVIQYSLGGHDFFWVNKELSGREPPSSGVGPKGEWLNYGGDKIWPAPQGWDNDEQWPGPPDAVLDGGPYKAEPIESRGQRVGVKLTSMKDVRSGIQFSRSFRIRNDSSRVSIKATMKNIDTKPRRWGIWAVTQFDASNRAGKGYNKEFYAYCPLNRESAFDKSYRVIFGMVNNTSWQPDYGKQMMRVNYQHVVGKIGLDSPDGWVATVDSKAGYAFVHRFEFEPELAYPDGTSVELWSQGLGEFTAWGKVNKMTDDPKENPYVMETEILSPFASLEPGESYSFSYEWYAAKIPAGACVTSCNEVGVMCEPLGAKVDGGKLAAQGSFGLFFEGTVDLVFLGQDGWPIGKVGGPIEVSPLEALEIVRILKTVGDVEVPEGAAKLVVNMHDKDTGFIGELGRTEIVR